MGKIMAVCISEKKGTQKQNIKESELVENFGLKNDAHGGDWHRQVSLLSYEKIEEFKTRGAQVKDGDFGENLVVSGIDLSSLPVGTKLELNGSLLEVTQIGKKCHQHCQIYHKVGDCIMPREGIFVRVLKGDVVKVGDEIKVIK